MVDVTELFAQILKPSLGCTDPAAVALGVAAAAQAACGWSPHTGDAPPRTVDFDAVKTVRVVVNRNLLKQSFSIPIPNSGGKRGLVMASALGVFCDPRRELELFADLDRGRIQAAEKIVAGGSVCVSVHPSVKADLLVDATVVIHTPAGLVSGTAAIRHEHANIVSLRRNSVEIFSKPGWEVYLAAVNAAPEGLRELTIAQMAAMVEDLPDEVLRLVRQTIRMNLQACEFGQARPLGLGTGFYTGKDGESLDTFHTAANMAAAASDARMSGYPVPVMSSAGSGNQGIIATIPVVVYSRHKGIDEERMVRAVALSHLVTMYLTSHIGYLSALCGVAVKAGIGAACGIVYANGGDADAIGRAVKVMVASLAGMICDGAKTSCALKVGTASDMAIRGAILAGNEVDIPNDSGIIGLTAEETVRNLATLGTSMDVVDDKILEIMTAKLESGSGRKVKPEFAPRQHRGDTEGGSPTNLDQRLRWNMF
jgi:L-cysteine desulfidase